MIKFLLVLVLLGVGGYFGYMYMHPEKRACARLMTDLCNRGGDAAADRAKCEEMFATLKEKGGRDAAASSADCIAQAGSCAAAVGCAAGAVGKVGVGFFGEFLKGAEKAFSDKK
jgi:hypothetical protein